MFLFRRCVDQRGILCTNIVNVSCVSASAVYSRNEQLFTYVKEIVKDAAQRVGDPDNHCKTCWPQDEFVIVKSALNNTRLDEHCDYYFLFGVDSLSWQCNIR